MNTLITFTVHLAWVIVLIYFATITIYSFDKDSSDSQNIEL